MNGVLNGGTVTVNVGILGGSGTVLGPVSVTDTLAPGNPGICKLTISNSLTLYSSATTVLQLNRTNAQNCDRIIAQSLALDGTLTVTNMGDPLQAGDTFALFSGSIAGAFTATNLPTLSSPNLNWDTTQLNSQGIIRVASSLPPQPLIQSPAILGSDFTLQVNSQPGFNYVLEATTNLVPANWIGIQTNPGGGVLIFTNVISGTNRQQFFRILVQ